MHPGDRHEDIEQNQKNRGLSQNHLAGIIIDAMLTKKKMFSLLTERHEHI